MLVRMDHVVVGRPRTRLRLPSSRKVTTRLRWWAFSVPGAAARRAAGGRSWRQTEMKASNVHRDAVSAAACAHHRTRGWPRPCATVFTKHGNGRQSPGWFQGQTYRPGGRGGASGPQHMVGPLRPDPAGNRLPAPHRIEGDDASRKTQHAQQGRDGRDCVGLPATTVRAGARRTPDAWGHRVESVRAACAYVLSPGQTGSAIPAFSQRMTPSSSTMCTKKQRIIRLLA